MKRIISIIAATMILLSAVSCKKAQSENLDDAVINGKINTFESGDTLSVSVWNDNEFYYNDKELKTCPSLYKGVTVGTDIETVLEVFDIKEGYAIINREISTPEEDGTTDIVTEGYKNLSFFETENVLDAAIIFGYNKTENGWKAASNEALEEGEADIIYNIDFVGQALAEDEKVSARHVISFTVTVS